VSSATAGIRSGSARVTVWRDGVRGRTQTATAADATLTVGALTGRLALGIKAKASAFVSAKATLAGGGHKLVVTLKRTPVVTPPPKTTSTPTTSTSTPPPPPPPPKTTTTTTVTPPPPPKTTTTPQIG
jgi:hypothetical protein